jgi:Uma2 family endonuclease
MSQMASTTPLRFPVEELLPETRRHLRLRTTLLEIVLETFGSRAAAGSDQFVYWDAADPSRCCAPDLFVRVGVPDTEFDTWKTWERGTPDLAVEITSTSDADEGPWDAKLTRYRSLGVRELVRFDPDENAVPLRIWDRVNDDLVERDPVDPSFLRCEALGAYWHLRPDVGPGLALRLSHDPGGRELFPTRAEAALAELERYRQG